MLIQNKVPVASRHSCFSK